ncbi:MAG: polyprenyl synthetase family protein [Chitinophagales bacterium]|nr:polyprenyl synthetase family protein [Chitinophagales bacterium]MDW8417852.1 polyprenyl synthetase family protein [Chitinophagales bacterium]
MELTLDQIRMPIARELDEFEIRFRESMRSNAPLLDRITHYIVSRKGKQMRPMFVFFSAKLCGEISDATYIAASLVEILHTATLVHDDVVDDSYRRRGFFSVNALWKNKIAVLVGDYLLSKGLLLSITNRQYHLLHLLSDTIRAMSEGELLQLEKARRLDIQEEVYYDIIRGKTASLIASACACGASTATRDAALIERCRLMGEHIGMAFQIKDDLFDYEEAETGKPRGLDIKERKMTLPLIYTLHKESFLTKRKIINIVKNHNQDAEKVRWVIETVRAAGGVDYARAKMMEFREKALDILHAFDESESRSAIGQLIDFTVNRAM